MSTRLAETMDSANSCVLHHDFHSDVGNDFPTGPHSGGSWTVTGTHPPLVRGEAFTNLSDGDAKAASYIEQALPADITRIGGTFRFPEDSQPGHTGAAGFISFKTTIKDWPSVPNSGMHLGVSLTCVQVLAITEGRGVFRHLLDYELDPPLQPGTDYLIDCRIDGPSVTFEMPDGQRIKVTNDLVATEAGPFACFEIYQNDPSTETRPEITFVWADC